MCGLVFLDRRGQVGKSGWRLLSSRTLGERQVQARLRGLPILAPGRRYVMGRAGGTKGLRDPDRRANYFTAINDRRAVRLWDFSQQIPAGFTALDVVIRHHCVDHIIGTTLGHVAGDAVGRSGVVAI